MGLKHLPLVSIVLFLLNILIGITLGGESLSGRLRCFWFLVEEQKKMLADFVVVIGITFIPKTWQNK
jgi:hypothetical protein